MKTKSRRVKLPTITDKPQNCSFDGYYAMSLIAAVERDTIKISITAAAEIVRLIDYLAGRSSGQYKPDNPFWYKRDNPYHNVGGTVADTVGNTFQSRYIPQQAPSGISQYSASPIHRSSPTMDNQNYETGLSPETTQKIDELKRLAYKYHQYQRK